LIGKDCGGGDEAGGAADKVAAGETGIRGHGLLRGTDSETLSMISAEILQPVRAVFRG
jgi:hypothetical protein